MDEKLKVYYDAEFTGLNRNTDLISIGLVSEYGNYFYAEFIDYDKTKITPWIRDNVIRNLEYNNLNNNGFTIVYPSIDNITNIEMKGDKEYIRKSLLDWIHVNFKDRKLQIYSDCYAYDWVLFNDLLADNGDALKLDESIYYIPMDLSTALQLYDIDPDINREEFIGENEVNKILLLDPFTKWGSNKHNSLWDAFVCKSCFNTLKSYKL